MKFNSESSLFKTVISVLVFLFIFYPFFTLAAESVDSSAKETSVVDSHSSNGIDITSADSIKIVSSTDSSLVDTSSKNSATTETDSLVASKDFGKGAQSAVGAAKTGVNNYVQTVAKETNWGNPSTLLDHTVRHGPTFGTLNPRTYATKAQEFLSGSNAMKVDSSGTTRAYNAQSNSFGAYNANGTTRTFFKPSERIGYWLSQVGNLVKK